MGGRHNGKWPGENGEIRRGKKARELLSEDSEQHAEGVRSLPRIHGFKTRPGQAISS